MIRAWCAGLVCFLLTSFSDATGASLLRTVALTGQQAPGQAAGEVFDDFNYVLLNAAGQVAFSGKLTGSGVNGLNDSSIWSEDSGSLTLVAREGGQAPDMPSGVSFTGFGDFAYSTGGHLGIVAGVQGIGVNNSNGGGFWTGRTGSLRLAVRQGDQVPGAPDGVTVDIDNDPPVNSSGRTAFVTDLRGNGVDNSNDGAIWSDAFGLPMLVAREGMHPPGTPSGSRFGYFGHPAINSPGQIAFQASVENELFSDQSIWLADSTSLTMIARTGEPAPSTSSGVNFGWVGWHQAAAALNSAGQVAFSATLSGIGVDHTNDNGIWSGTVGSLRVVARAGDDAPGTPAGTKFGQLEDPLLNSASHAAFLAGLNGVGVNTSNDLSIWSEGSGSLSMVAREGTHAPGVPEGVNFGEMSYVHLVLNSAGQVAFATHLNRNGVGGVGGYGIWAEDRSGILRLVVVEEDQLEVAPGDYRTVRNIDFICCTSSDEGHFNAFNNRGQLAFRADFYDGTSGIFVSSVAAVPEPNPLLLAAAAIVGPLSRLRRVRPERASRNRLR